MRPYNSYRNPELSQPVSSVENTLSSKTSNQNSSFDILRSLSESISVDCGSFEISAPTEYYQSSSVPAQAAFVSPSGKEIRTPVERVSQTPVHNELAQRTYTPEKQSVNPTSDMDDDNYDCMNDPNYRAQCEKKSGSPSFEELMARASEGIAKMREETQAAYSVPGSNPKHENRINTENSKSQQFQTKNVEDSVQRTPQGEVKPSIDAPSESSAKKRFLLSINWNKTRKLLFNRESIKLALLSIAVSAVIVSAVIYKKSPRRNNGLPESENVVVNQSFSDIQDASAENDVVNSNNGELNSTNDNFWNAPNNDVWDSSIAVNPQNMTDPLQDNYQSPTFDPNASELSPNTPNSYLNAEDSGHQIVSPHNSDYDNQMVNNMPIYNVEPKTAEISPAIGGQYNPNDYESPVLEDDSVRGYSETGYNSNFMR